MKFVDEEVYNSISSRRVEIEFFYVKFEIKKLKCSEIIHSITVNMKGIY